MTKNRPLFFSLAGCAAICLILRIALKLTAIDPATGFYEGGGALPHLFNVLLGVSVPLLLVVGFFAGRDVTGSRVDFYTPLRVLAYLVSIALAFWTVFRMGWWGIEVFSGAFSSSMPILPQLLVFIFTILFRLILPIAIIYIFAFIVGYSPFREARKTKPGESEPDLAKPLNPFNLTEAHGYLRANGWLMLLPLVWGIGELLSSFMAYTALRNVSDQMLTILMLILMAPFLLAHARLLSGVGAEKGMRQLLLFGPAFSLVAVTVSGGTLAAALAGRTVDLGLEPAAAAFYLMLGIYTAALCLSVRKAAQ